MESEISQLTLKILDFSCKNGSNLEMEKCIDIVVNNLPFNELSKYIFEPNLWIREKILARIKRGE